MKKPVYSFSTHGNRKYKIYFNQTNNVSKLILEDYNSVLYQSVLIKNQVTCQRPSKQWAFICFVWITLKKILPADKDHCRFSIISLLIVTIEINKMLIRYRNNIKY